MRRRRRLVPAALLVAAAAAPLPAWEVDAGAPRAELEAFHRYFAAAAYPYPGHGATPLGITGWELSGRLTGAPDFRAESGAGDALRGGLTGGALGVARISARKGLPGGFDVGLGYGRALESDLDLLHGELQWAWVPGGPVAPAIGLRAVYSESSGSASYRLRQTGVEALASKGFAVVAIYGGAGLVRSEGRFSPEAAPALAVRGNRGVAYAGLRLLLVPKITFELQSGEQLTGTVSVSLGF